MQKSINIMVPSRESWANSASQTLCAGSAELVGPCLNSFVCVQIPLQGGLAQFIIPLFLVAEHLEIINIAKLL